MLATIRPQRHSLRPFRSLRHARESIPRETADVGSADDSPWKPPLFRDQNRPKWIGKQLVDKENTVNRFGELDPLGSRGRIHVAVRVVMNDIVAHEETILVSAVGLAVVVEVPEET